MKRPVVRKGVFDYLLPGVRSSTSSSSPAPCELVRSARYLRMSMSFSYTIPVVVTHDIAAQVG